MGGDNAILVAERDWQLLRQQRAEPPICVAADAQRNCVRPTQTWSICAC